MVFQGQGSGANLVRENRGSLAWSPGSQIGAYEIVGPIGAGGMGEVCRAKNPVLNRHIALKVLPASVAGDADRLARFRRGAQLLASLNHPNIGHIHGFESSGASQALVLELIEGPTLADRIARGPIPLDEALPIARQIARRASVSLLTRCAPSDDVVRNAVGRDGLPTVALGERVAVHLRSPELTASYGGQPSRESRAKVGYQN